MILKCSNYVLLMSNKVEVLNDDDSSTVWTGSTTNKKEIFVLFSARRVETVVCRL